MRKYFVLAVALTLAALIYASFTVHSRGSKQAHRTQAASLSFLSTHNSPAANFTVNSLGDTPDALLADGLCADANGACTLRAAIQQANFAPPGDIIGFSVTGVINLTGALPDLSTDITINGPGASQLTVRRDTGGDYRIFTVKRRRDGEHLRPHRQQRRAAPDEAALTLTAAAAASTTRAR